MLPYALSETELKNALVKLNEKEFGGEAQIILYPEDGVYAWLVIGDFLTVVKPDGIYYPTGVIERELAC